MIEVKADDVVRDFEAWYDMGVRGDICRILPSSTKLVHNYEYLHADNAFISYQSTESCFSAGITCEDSDITFNVCSRF